MANQFKIGDKVNYHSRINGPVTSTDHEITEMQKMCGTMCAWITNKASCVDVDALSHVS